MHLRQAAFWIFLISQLAGCAAAPGHPPTSQVDHVPPPATVRAMPTPTPTTLAGDDAMPTTVTCIAQVSLGHCQDRLLDLDFTYPLFMGELAASELRPGSGDGLAYAYQFVAGETGAAAGGRSRDFSEGRGFMYTDQVGFGGRSVAEICAAWSAAICRAVRPGVIFMGLFPRAEWFCSDAIALTAVPRALIVANLPQHPLIHGFGFTASILPPADEAELASAWQDRHLGQVCAPEAQASFDVTMEELRLGLEGGTAEPVVQARYAALLQLAESIEGPYVRHDDAPRNAAYDASAHRLQAVISALLTDDGEGLKELIHYASFGCTQTAALGGPPRCRPGEAEGTPVLGLPLLSAEGVVVRPDEIDGVVDTLLARPLILVDILVEPAESYTEAEWWPARSAALLVDTSLPYAVALLVDDVGIVRMYDARQVDELPPRVSAATAEPASGK